jgi:peptidyl-prolyl cis-trans isomerase A (cyclophilin A)
MKWKRLLWQRASVVMFPWLGVVGLLMFVVASHSTRGVPLQPDHLTRGAQDVAAARPENPAAPDPEAPAEFRVRLETTKGAIVIDVHRAWAPHGADRFHRLVESRYYDDARFFRVVKGQWAQFGINGDPAVASAWRTRTIPDDPPKESNVRGTVTFAFAVPDGRATQVYIALTDLSARQDSHGFVPFGRVVEGMEVADVLNAEYGEGAGGGIRAGRQQPLFDGGNAYLDREFPRLDRILRARKVR